MGNCKTKNNKIHTPHIPHSGWQKAEPKLKRDVICFT